jgi:phytoene/squalene synthetase
MMSSLAAAITKAASKQTYYTIRFLVDRPLVDDAYRAYAYFRWVDDVVDAVTSTGFDASDTERLLRMRFLERQTSLLEACLSGDEPGEVNRHEAMLVDLARDAGRTDPRLVAYLRYMMLVMAFDVGRRGRLVTRQELDDYTHWLAIAVAEAMLYFIGNDASAPDDETRYEAVSGAHIVHMLRDTYTDVRAGYFNVPREVLAASSIGPADVRCDAYRAWVRERVLRARAHFEAGAFLLRTHREPSASPGRDRIFGALRVVDRDARAERLHASGGVPRATTLGDGNAHGSARPLVAGLSTLAPPSGTSGRSDPRGPIMKSRSVLVVGAGVAGITAATHLARSGLHVTVVEKDDVPGGRCGRFVRDGHRFDTGPTLFVMPLLYASEFRALGVSLAERLELRPVDPTYRLVFDDGDQLSLTSDMTTMREQLESIEPGSFDGLERYMKTGARHYRVVAEKMVNRDFRWPLDWPAFLSASLDGGEAQLDHFGGPKLPGALRANVRRQDPFGVC